MGVALTPEDYHLNRICLITSCCTRKKPIQVKRLEVQPKTENHSLLLIFFKCTLKDTLTTKIVAFCHEVRPDSYLYF